MPISPCYVYKITYHNGKIYVGYDKLGEFATYFGSTTNGALIAREHSDEQLRHFVVRKEILFEAETAAEAQSREYEFIVAHKANDPAVGYNLRPKFVESRQ